MIHPDELNKVIRITTPIFFQVFEGSTNIFDISKNAIVLFQYD